MTHPTEHARPTKRLFIAEHSRTTSFFAVLLCIAASLLFLAASTSAQTAVTGGLRGSVTDTAGAAVSGATVQIENRVLALRQESVTNPDGQFTFLGLPPSEDYMMTISANGFYVFTRGGVAITTGETNAVDARLEVAPLNETITVTGAETQLSESAEVSQVIDEKQLNELPVYNRSLNRIALLNPHVRNTAGLGGDGLSATRLSINGRIFRETHYKLDGNNNFDALFNNAPLQTVSLSAVQEYKVLTNQYAAEHGGTTAGFLIATTKSGTNEFNGEGFFFGRPSGIQARPPLADRRIPNQLLQYGGSVGGAIVPDKTFFFFNYEGTRQSRGSFVERPRPATFVGELRENLGLVKIDHHFSDTHTAALRLNGSRNTNSNPNDRITFLAQSVQPIQPSAAVFSILQSVGVQLNDTYVRGNFINELRVSYTNAIPSSSIPVTPGLGIVRAGVSTEGNSTYSQVRLENSQIAEQMSLQLGRHSLKFGGDYTRQKLRDFSYQQFGTYNFDTAGAVTGFTQQLGTQALRYGQTRIDAFIQDDWRVSSRLTLNLGLRYDYQSIIDDYNNFGPRAGFAFDLTGDGNTVVRGGAGFYYDQPFFHGFTQRYLQNAPQSIFRTITLSADEAAAFFPNSFDPNDTRAGVQSPRSLFLRGEDIRNPYTAQFSLGIQRKLFGDFVLTADVIHNLSRKQLQAFNINAPSPFPRNAPGQSRSQAAANLTRPFTTYLGVPVRDVLVSTNSGNATYDALDLGLTKRFAGRYGFEAHYVYSSAIDTVIDDHLGANPNEWSDIARAERAQSDFNQRHRFVAFGTVDLPFQSRLALTATLASALPINPLTGVDNNGDGRTVDRPAGFGRNSFKGTRQTRFDASYARSFTLINEGARLELRADVFNLFNNSNFYRFTNRYGNGASPDQSFMRPIGGVSNVDPGRQLQFGARFVF